MAALAIRDANDQLVYLDMEGTGDAIDPFRPRQIDQAILPDAIYTAQVSITAVGQIVQLPAGALQVGVVIKALATNQGNIYIGGPTVSATTGFELNAGEQITLRVAELSTLYVTTSAANEGICLLGV